MILVYFVGAALVLGWLLGGRPEHLGAVRLHWAGLAIAGLLVQVALFSPPVTGWIGAAGPPVYVLSTAAVLLAVLRNLRQPGIVVLALGAVLNAIVVLANGGYMPVSSDALATLGRPTPTGVYGNTVTGGTSTAFAWLGDNFAVPPPIPLANAVSIGDVLIGIGAAGFVVRGMRGPARTSAAPRTRVGTDAGSAGHAPAAGEGLRG